MEAVTRALAARVREGLAAGGIDAARDPKAVRALIDRAIDAHAPDMLPTQREQVEADLMDDICGLGPLQALMDDPGVEEIWINSASRVFVARGGVAELTSLILTDEDVRALVERMLHHSGRRLDLSSPFVDAMLAGGERLHVVIPPVTGRSWSVNIRKHIQRARTLEDLVAVDMVPPPMRDFLSAAVLRGPVCPGLGRHAGRQDDAAARARGRAAAFAARHLLRGGLRTGPGELGSRGHADAPAGRGGDGGDHPARPRARVPAYATRVPDRRRGARPRGPRPARGPQRGRARHGDRARELGARGPRQALDPAAPGRRERHDGIRDAHPGLVHRPRVSRRTRPRMGSATSPRFSRCPGVSKAIGSRRPRSSRFDGRRCERGPGGLDLHDRFAAAGFDLASLLDWGTL